ncbi:uncharacterized protein [Lolium perenne]|uniref:uncharacterized protein isoform X2 n=1 Tax=Lolium perenne TaxID=4522 RepID=UPI0021F5D600|nr:uncharacterized protein LOC127292987 isoform X2 [Lolium perenne]
MAPRPHAVVLPYPFSGTINPALQIAKLLHRRGVYVTFVNTEHNHRKAGADAVRGHDGFRFESIPDGLDEAARAVQDYGRGLCISTRTRCAAPLRDLVARLNATPGVPAVTCVVPALMSFALDVARELGVPTMAFWGGSAASLMSHMRIPELQDRGYLPLKELPDQRPSGDNGHRLDPRHAADQPRRRIQLRPHHRSGRLRAAVQRVRGHQLHQGRRPHPQHIPRPRGRRPRRAPRRVPVHLHHRPTGIPPQPRHRRRRPKRLVLHQRPEPVEAGHGMPHVARNARSEIRRVRQLRQPHGADAGAARRVRVGPGGQRPRVALVHQGEPRPRRRSGRAPAGVRRRNGGPVPPHHVVPAGAGAAAPGRGVLPHAQRVELHLREPGRRRAHGVLAGIRRPVHQLQVRLRGVGSGPPA